jgi:hypothetical protein
MIGDPSHGMRPERGRGGRPATGTGSARASTGPSRCARLPPAGRGMAGARGDGALLIAAPLSPAPRGWGVFLPLHALRTDEDWGVGSYTDMAELGEWVGEMGGSMLGALPLYPAFLDPPADPSPYLPVSRLAYNELFVDPRPPRARRCTPRRAGCWRPTSSGVASVAPPVDAGGLRGGVPLRRQVLAPMAEALLGGEPRRAATMPSAPSSTSTPSCWPTRASGPPATGSGTGSRAPSGDGRSPDPRPGPTSPRSGTTSTRSGRRHSSSRRPPSTVPLYADLPIGVHPDGFDPSGRRRPSCRGARGRAPRPLLRGRPGLGVSPPPSRADAGRRVPLLHRCAPARLPPRRLPAGRSRHGSAAPVLDPRGLRRPPRRLRVVPGRRAPCGGRAGGAPGRGGRRGRGPGHGARRGAAPHGRGSDAALVGPPVRIDGGGPAAARPPACWRRGARTTCRASAYFWGDDIDERERGSSRRPTPRRNAPVGSAGAALRSVSPGGRTPTEDDEEAERGVPALALRGCLLHLARARRTSSWSTSRICGGSASRRTGRVPGPAAPTGGAGRRAHSKRRASTPRPPSSCARSTAPSRRARRRPRSGRGLR